MKSHTDDLKQRNHKMDLEQRNHEIVTQIRNKQMKLARLKAIQEEDDNTRSAAWYLSIWNYCVVSVTTVMMFLGTLLTYLHPATLVANWAQTLFSVKQFFEKTNKTLLDYAKVFVNVSFAIAMTSLFILGAKTVCTVLGVAAILPALPYVALGIFGGCLLHGLFHFGKSIYRAVNADKNDERNEYLKQAGKHLINIVVNSLAIVATVIFGIKMRDAIDKIDDAISRYDYQTAIDFGKKCIEYAETGKKVLIALTTFVAAGIVAETAKMNQETATTLWNAVRHPIQTARQIKYAIKENPFVIVKELLLAPVKIPLRIASLVIAGPVQLIAAGAKKLFNAVFNRKKTKTSQVAADSGTTSIAQPPIAESDNVCSQTLINKLQNQSADAAPLITQSKSTEVKASVLATHDEAKALINEWQDQVNKLDSEFPSIEDASSMKQSKRFQAGNMLRLMQKNAGLAVQSDYHCVAEIEKDAKDISPHVYHSLFGNSVTKRLTVATEQHLNSKKMVKA